MKLKWNLNHSVLVWFQWRNESQSTCTKLRMWKVTIFEIAELGEHMKKLHDATCTGCELQFSDEYALERHAKLVHVAKCELFLCTECGANFTVKHAFKRHARLKVVLKSQI